MPFHPGSSPLPKRSGCPPSRPPSLVSPRRTSRKVSSRAAARPAMAEETRLQETSHLIRSCRTGVGTSGDMGRCGSADCRIGQYRQQWEAVGGQDRAQRSTGAPRARAATRSSDPNCCGWSWSRSGTRPLQMLPAGRTQVRLVTVPLVRRSAPGVLRLLASGRGIPACT